LAYVVTWVLQLGYGGWVLLRWRRAVADERKLNGR
jgi:hypothetical protein